MQVRSLMLDDRGQLRAMWLLHFAAAPAGFSSPAGILGILRDRDADPATLAAWARGHCEIENRLHWVRDVTYQEDKSLVRTGYAPRVMASLSSLAISMLRLHGHANIAATTLATRNER